MHEHGQRLRAQARKQSQSQTPWSLDVAGIHVEFGHQCVDDEARVALNAWLEHKQVAQALDDLFSARVVNRTEQRAATHWRCRSTELDDCCAAFQQHIERFQAAGITDIVHLGIGGSDLGPRFVVDALRPDEPQIRVHFLSNLDLEASRTWLNTLSPERTALVVVSKSFSTAETFSNVDHVLACLGDLPVRLAITANPERALARGFQADECLPMADSVGGRYSLWSSVGFAIAAACGVDAFRALCDGARRMDEHVKNAPLQENLSVQLGMLAVFNHNAMHCAAHAFIGYDDRLRLLDPYLQQLMMESLGKSVSVDGQPLTCKTSSVVFGGVGTDVQHSFMQALHQGTERVACDLLACVHPLHDDQARHQHLLANLLAQAEALAVGKDDTQAEKQHPGGNPVTVLLLERIDAPTLGALLAAYEHSVYVQAVLLGINPFDQFGVELGKNIAKSVRPALEHGEDIAQFTPTTQALIKHLRS